MLLSLILQSQGTSVLDQYVDQALSNNLSLQRISLSEARQSTIVDQAQKRWQPNVDLNANYLFAEGGRKLLFPIGDLFNPAYGALNQLTGTEQFPTDLENVETQLTPNNFIDANLTITKPIINSAIKHNVLIQKALLNLSAADRNIQRNELTFQVKQAYYNYCKTNQGAKILEHNLELLGDVLKFNKKLIKYDKATPDVISDINYQEALLYSQVDGLKEQQEMSKMLFNTLLNRDLSADIIIDTSLFANVVFSNNELASLIQQAVKARPELAKLKIVDQVNDLNVQRIEKSGQPTLGVQGAIGIQAQEFSFDEGGPLYTVGLNLGWNIWDGGLRKKQLEELEIAKQQNNLETQIAEQQITLEVGQVYHKLRMLYANLSAEEAAIEAATTSYNAINNRYRNDRALLIELLTAQSKLTSSELNKVLLKIDILIAQAELKRIIYEL